MKKELKKRKAVVTMPADVKMSERHLDKLHRMESNNAKSGDLQEAPAKKLGCLSNKLKCLDFSATGLFSHRECNLKFSAGELYQRKCCSCCKLCEAILVH